MGQSQKKFKQETIIRAKENLDAALEAVAELPLDDQKSLLFELDQVIKEALQNCRPAPPLPSPDPTGESYSLYKSRTNALAHLEKHWGRWLKAYNSELDRDYLYQDELGVRDRDLLKALKNQISRLNALGGARKKLRDYISPRHYRTDVELAEIPEDTIKRYESLAHCRRNRKL